MKLAFCLFNYFPYGGLQRDFMRIAQACQRQGHTIHVYTMAWEGEREANFHIHLIKVKGWQNHTRQQHFIKQVREALASEKYDRVIGFNKMPGLDVYYAADVCFQARAAEKHGKWYQWLPRYRHLKASEAAVFEKGKPTDILLIAPKQQAIFESYYQTEPHRFHLLPPGIAKDRIAPANAAEIRKNFRDEFGLKSQDVLLLMVGSGFKTKGLDRAIQAIAHLPAEELVRTQLYVVGQDNAAPFIALAEKLKVRQHIRFLGGRPDVTRFMLGADILLHPAYHENTGTVLLEAMVSGLPVLTVDVCGYAHYVTDANAGMVLPSPFDQTHLNAALLTMLQSKDQSIWKQNGLTFAREADIYDMATHAAEHCLATPGTKMPTRFEEYMHLSGECFRDQKGRLTQRIMLNNQPYFIKQHHGVGWREIFKNLIQGRLPVISAKNEWLAIKKLEALGVYVPTAVGYEVKGINPAKKKSFVLMKEIAPAVSLEDLSKTWHKSPPSFHFKQQLIEAVARIARLMHVNGINHRDFYICHFLLDTSEAPALSSPPRLFLIDLHRAQIRHLTPVRWIIKDLAGLYFSSKDIGLTQRDLYRFIQEYTQLPIKKAIEHQGSFWNKVKARGEELYHDHSN